MHYFRNELGGKGARVFVNPFIKVYRLANILSFSVKNYTRYTFFLIPMLVISILGSHSAQANKARYAPKDINRQASNFAARANKQIINVDFLIAHLANKSYHTVRQGRENINSRVNVIDGANTAGTPSAGSVVIQPGNDIVGDLVIINQNEGDNIVINE